MIRTEIKKQCSICAEKYTFKIRADVSKFKGYEKFRYSLRRNEYMLDDNSITKIIENENGEKNCTFLFECPNCHNMIEFQVKDNTK